MTAKARRVIVQWNSQDARKRGRLVLSEMKDGVGGEIKGLKRL